MKINHSTNQPGVCGRMSGWSISNCSRAGNSVWCLCWCSTKRACLGGMSSRSINPLLNQPLGHFRCPSPRRHWPRSSLHHSRNSRRAWPSTSTANLPRISRVEVQESSTVEGSSRVTDGYENAHENGERTHRIGHTNSSTNGHDELRVYSGGTARSQSFQKNANFSTGSREQRAWWNVFGESDNREDSHGRRSWTTQDDLGRVEITTLRTWIWHFYMTPNLVTLSQPHENAIIVLRFSIPSIWKTWS